MSIVQNKQLKTPALVVVSAKEHGKVYELDGSGKLTLSEYVTEHPPGYSDNEGFFFRSGNGMHMGSGAPREEDQARNLERYIKAIGAELSQHIAQFNPKAVYVFEPEHLKGKIKEELGNEVSEVEVIVEGNYVNHPIEEIVKLLNQHALDNDLDPADPASVAGEENAQEKRKILETAQLRQN